MLSVNELLALEDAIRANLDDCLLQTITRLNRTGQLEELLELLGMLNLIKKDAVYEPYKTGKILIIGDTKVKEKDPRGIAKGQGINPDRLECCLEYKDSKTYDFEHVRYNAKYSLIMVGPMPHSGISKENYGSVISRLEQEEGFPPVVRLGTQNLNISKSSVRNAFAEQIEQQRILPDT